MSSSHKLQQMTNKEGNYFQTRDPRQHRTEILERREAHIVSSTSTLVLCRDKPFKPQEPTSGAQAGHSGLPEQKRQGLKFRAAKGLECAGHHKDKFLEVCVGVPSRSLAEGTDAHIRTKLCKAPQREDAAGLSAEWRHRKQLSAGRLWNSCPSQVGDLARPSEHLLRGQEGHVVAGSIMPSSVESSLEQRSEKMFYKPKK